MKKARQCSSVCNERKPRPYCNIVRSKTGLPVDFTEWVLIQTSFIEFITLCQSLSCDIPCLDWPSLSSKWPQIKVTVTPPPGKIWKERAFAKYSNFELVQWSAIFEFPLWINKPLFGAKAIVSRSPFMAVFATLNKKHCLWIWSAFLDTRVIMIVNG